MSVHPTVRPHKKTQFQLDGFAWNFKFDYFSKICREKSRYLKSDKNKWYFALRTIYIFIISRSVLLRMRNVSEKICRETRNTHFVFNFFFLNRAVYEIMWGNLVEPGRPQVRTWRMRIACWITKARDTHNQVV